MISVKQRSSRRRSVSRRAVSPVVPAAAPTVLWWLITGVGALLLLTASVPTATAVYRIPLLLSFVACTAQCAALPLALVRARTATAVQFAAIAVLALAAPVLPGPLWPLPITGVVALSAHIAILGLRQTWGTAVLTWWASAALSIGLVVVDPQHRGTEVAGDSLTVYTATSVVVLAAILAHRQRSRISEQLREARRDVELEQSRRALGEERTRIARELHDIVAHSMSVVHMQASTVRYRRPDLDAEMLQELGQIAAVAKGAMREMRQILTVLRDESSPAATAPAPDLSQLHQLAESARQAGSPTTVRLQPGVDWPSVPAGVGVAAYRIVQEALSNVVRHAPGAEARVVADLDVTTGVLLITVTNQAPHHPVPAVDQTDQVEEDSPRRLHLGLVGMRERANLLGGSVSYGSTPSGGFMIAARLPLGEARPEVVTATQTASTSPGGGR